MSQPEPHPHDVSGLMEPVLDGIVHALADRRGRTAAQYDASAAETWILIQSFQPRDAIDLMLIGQLVGFNQVVADSIRDILREMPDATKQRSRSSLVALGRLALSHVDRLEKRGIQPHRTEVAAPQPEQRTAVEIQLPAAAVPDASPRAVPPPESAAAQPSAELEPENFAAALPAEELSWLEEPFEEVFLETPAMLAARDEAAPLMSEQPEETGHVNGVVPDWSGALPDPDLPYPTPGSTVVETMAGAEDG